jgi:hypothetical protein
MGEQNTERRKGTVNDGPVVCYCEAQHYAAYEWTLMLLIKGHHNVPINVSHEHKRLEFAVTDGNNTFFMCAKSFARSLQTFFRDAAYCADRDRNGTENQSEQRQLTYQFALHIDYSNWIRCVGTVVVNIFLWPEVSDDDSRCKRKE